MIGIESVAAFICDLGEIPAGSTDVTLLLDVLEHVDDDRSLLRAAAR